MPWSCPMVISYKQWKQTHATAIKQTDNTCACSNLFHSLNHCVMISLIYLPFNHGCLSSSRASIRCPSSNLKCCSWEYSTTRSCDEFLFLCQLNLFTIGFVTYWNRLSDPDKLDSFLVWHDIELKLSWKSLHFAGPISFIVSVDRFALCTRDHRRLCLLEQLHYACMAILYQGDGGIQIHMVVISCHVIN